MCGWPFSLSTPQPQLIVAPVPAAPRYQGRAVYFTDLVVRQEAGYRSLKDTFGGRIAWTVEGSHSGFNAPRHHLLAFRTVKRKSLYSKSIGPVITPVNALASVIEDQADVAPLDSFALDLIRQHEPKRLADIDVIDSTAPAPIPPLVAGPKVSSADVSALRKAFLSAADAIELRPVMADLCLHEFAVVAAEDYQLTKQWQNESLEAGYVRPE